MFSNPLFFMYHCIICIYMARTWCFKLNMFIRVNRSCQRTFWVDLLYDYFFFFYVIHAFIRLTNDGNILNTFCLFLFGCLITDSFGTKHVYNTKQGDVYYSLIYQVNFISIHCCSKGLHACILSFLKYWQIQSSWLFNI